jgi:WD40 repeat protein
VWELRWVDQNSERGEKLVSISSDGRITQWTIKKGLEHTDLFKLKKVENPAKQKETKSEAFISRNASGFCFDFSPSDPQQYICGTEEGNIHLCSRSYNHVLQTFNGHTGPVYKVKFSPFHSGLLLSASADWSCKMWHADSGRMLLSYQPNNTPMTDVCWSPSKPTVFATTSFDGKLQVYDIAQNQMDPSCTFHIKNEDVAAAVESEQPVEGTEGEEDSHHEAEEHAAGGDSATPATQEVVPKTDRPVALNALSFGVNSPVVIAGSEDGQVRTFTVHGLSSQQFQKDPVELLEGILMMGQDHTAAVSEEV